MKHIKQYKINFLSVLLFVFIVFLFKVPVYAGNGATDALTQGKNLFETNQKCACPSYIVAMDGNMYNYTGASATECSYSNGSSSLKKLCNASNTDEALNKFVTAGVFKDKTAASAWESNAAYYRTVVMSDIVQKQQQCDAKGKCTTVDTATAACKNGATNCNTARGLSSITQAMNTLNDNMHWVYSFLLGIGLITAMVAFMTIFIKMTYMPDHPMIRFRTMQSFIRSGISVVLLGGIWLFVSLFQSSFDDFWATNAFYSKDWKTVGNMVLYEYKNLVVGAFGIATLTVLFMFVHNIISLTLHAGNPRERQGKIKGILMCGLAAAGLGAITIWLGFFWNALQG